jgi:hypothetical protein
MNQKSAHASRRAADLFESYSAQPFRKRLAPEFRRHHLPSCVAVRRTRSKTPTSPRPHWRVLTGSKVTESGLHRGLTALEQTEVVVDTNYLA